MERSHKLLLLVVLVLLMDCNLCSTAFSVATGGLDDVNDE